MNTHGKLNYVEFHSKDLEATKAFFIVAFGWSFTDYGPEYTAFSDEGLDGGFFKSNERADDIKGHPVLIFYSDRLEESLAEVKTAGGSITREIFDFPGGQRFHFTEPGGNEFAVWGELPQ
ncbi:MAG: VOC family protein [Rhodobacteraceae bacterium]|nr:VOC family protein [Paracoccaceae bacterium]